MRRVIAGHIPREDPELGQTARVDARRVDCHVDGLSVVSVGIASVRAVEEELAGGVVGEQGCQDVAEVATHLNGRVLAEVGVLACCGGRGGCLT